jgi:hypothetical protein
VHHHVFGEAAGERAAERIFLFVRSRFAVDPSGEKVRGDTIAFFEPRHFDACFRDDAGRVGDDDQRRLRQLGLLREVVTEDDVLVAVIE